MDSPTTNNKSRAILSSPGLTFALWWLPPIAIVVAASSGFSVAWRTIVWTIALGIMGTACVFNAMRCRRVHCYFTGPFFLLMALVTLLFGLGMVPMGKKGWNLIGLGILVGGLGLYCLPELFLGYIPREVPRKATTASAV